MSDEISVSVSLPLDSDGFVRRQCSKCEREFEWLHSSTDESEPVDQYFCPLCGKASNTDSWDTSAQAEQAYAAAIQEIGEGIQRAFEDAIRGSKFVVFKSDSSFSLDADGPEPLEEPDDMVIVEPPCHPVERLKVPDDSTERVYCLVCGVPFTT